MLRAVALTSKLRLWRNPNAVQQAASLLPSGVKSRLFISELVAVETWGN